MRTLLVTAFGAFPGAAFNPSAEVVRRLEGSARAFARAGVRLRTGVLPVVHDIAPALEEIVAHTQPDAVLHIGVAAGRTRASVETRARNRVSMLRPDARGRYPARATLAAGRAHTARTTWNARRFVAALRRERIQARLSVDAGDYVCNAVLWTSLRAFAIPTVFLHIPRARRLAPARLATALARILPGMTATLNRDR